MRPLRQDGLRSLRRPGESYSDVILRLESKGPDKSGDAPLQRRPDEKPKRGQRQKGAEYQRHSNQEIKPVFTRHSRPPSHHSELLTLDLPQSLFLASRLSDLVL
jgi:hypothetical protein